MKTPAQRIKEARKQAGLTQKDMATLYGIPQRTIEDWDRLVHEPPEYVANLIIDRIKADFLHDHSKVLSEADAPKTKIFTNYMGKPLTPEEEAGARKAFEDGKVQFVGTEDEEGNEIENPRKGKPYMILTPEEYGLDMGLTVFVKEV